MRVHIWLMLAGLVLLGSCSRQGKVIPRSTMARIYADIFVADQWLRDHGSMRTKADTTLYYDPIFEKYGYDRKAFLASVNHYIDNPQKFSRILSASADLIKADQEKYASYAQIEEKVRKANEIYRHYRRVDFSNDSVNWSRHENIVWTPWRDTVAQAADTAAAVLDKEDLIKLYDNVEGKDSVRADKKPEARKLPGCEPSAREWEDL